MKQGKNLNTLADEIMRRNDAKKDLVVPVPAIVMQESGLLKVNGSGEFDVLPYAHRQIAEYADVPQAFYDRLRTEHAPLFAATVNELTQHKAGNDKRFVRVLDGHVRAYLSDRYRPLDNVDLMTNLLPTIMDRKDIAWASAEVTDTRLYIKLLSQELEGTTALGDVVRMGIIIQNSEVGAGSLIVAPFTERLSCTNGMTHVSLGKRRAHLGRVLEGAADTMEYFADDTRKASDQAFFLQARDSVKAALNGETLGKIIADLDEASDDRIEDEATVPAVAEAVAKQINMDGGEKTAMLRHLLQAGDFTRFGVAQAVTRTAADVPSYDRASELEKLGGDIIHTARMVDFKPAIKVRTRRAYRPTLAAATAD